MTTSRTMATKSPKRGTRNLPIDRGWAWVVLLCYFTNSVLMMGYYKSFGIVFVEMLRKFQSSASSTSLLIGIQSMFISIGGLLSTTVLMTYLSARQIIIMGGVLLSSGIILTTFAESLAVVIFFQSVLVGLGIVMIFSPGQTLVCQYFNKRRATAFSLGMAGTSVGGLVTPPVLRLLLDAFGLDGALLIHGAIVLNVVVFGALMRPLEWYTGRAAGETEKTVLVETGLETKDSLELRALVSDTKDTGSVVAAIEANSEEKIPHLQSHASRGDVTQLRNSSSVLHNGNEVVGLRFPTTPHGSCVLDISAIGSPFHGQALRYRYHLYKSLLYVPTSHEEGSKRITSSTEEQESVRKKKLFASLPNLLDYSQKEAVFAPVNNAPVRSEQDVPGISAGGFEGQDGECSDGQLGACASTSNHEESSQCAIHPKSPQEEKQLTCCQRAASLFEVFLFKQVRFYLVLSVSGLSILPTILTISYLPALAADRGLSDVTAAHLLMVAAVCGIVARIVLGLVTDSGRVRINYVGALTLALLAIILQFVPYFHDEPAFMAFAVLLGLFGDSYFLIIPIWIAVSYGEVMFRKVFGFSVLMEGMFLCGGSPFCGWLRDVTGSFNAVYHFLGVCAFLSAVILLVDVRLPPDKVERESIYREP